MDIAIVGAGIGGLATALALHAAGLDKVTIYESVSELRPLGVGINLLPHAVRELTELGVRDRVAEIAVATSALNYYNRFGQQIWSEPRGFAAGYQWPQYSVHRGQLQLLLRDIVLDRLGAGAIRTGHTVRETREENGSTIMCITEPDGSARWIAADVVVGADGIHSALRRQQYPDEGKPIWNGLILWRGTARTTSYLDGHTMIMAGDELQKFVAYPLTEPDTAGLQTINFIAEHRSDGTDPGSTSWNRRVSHDTVLERFADWDFGWLNVPNVVAAAEDIFEYPMVDRDPLPRWTFGRHTLMGDAAHPMYPIGSNGASQAIIDARVLARELGTMGTSAGTVELALDAYETERRPTTTQLTLSNRSMGPEFVMRLARERAPDGFDDIEQVIPYAEREGIAAAYKATAGFSPDALNARPSFSVPHPAASPSARTVQLRRYEFAPGDMEAFVRWWSTRLVPVRLAAGFTIEFAYSLPDHNEFIWAVSVAGDQALFTSVESSYRTSPERDIAFSAAPPQALAQHIAFASVADADPAR